ncbi:hypothetical protein N657DRAFT_148807 [Parathielavia appendiculata]|uniref:Transmembrane protein n=1 Tax=Parathielavia appendiculata TaxID=2587402 RepID=A0AAN6TTX9_9PEZI|nr:hypothetical protein N657DRAFT_148807 [Parathielavia appendiculata]
MMLHNPTVPSISRVFALSSVLSFFSSLYYLLCLSVPFFFLFFSPSFICNFYFAFPTFLLFTFSSSFFAFLWIGKADDAAAICKPNLRLMESRRFSRNMNTFWRWLFLHQSPELA